MGFSPSKPNAAARALAVDALWTGSDGGPTKHGSNLVRRALNSYVEPRHLSVYDLDPAEGGRFDVVLFLGVLYHIREPLGALERVRSVTPGVAVIETQTDMLWKRRPAIGFRLRTER